MAAMISVADLNSSDPLRPVAWRYQAAAERVASGLAFRRRDWDRETLETAYYLAGLRRGEAPRRLAAKFPDLHQAIGIFGDERPELRWALEARVMAAQATADIAAALGVAPLVVAVYEAIFFDAFDRLENVDFVMQRIITRPASESYRFADSGWKLIGYIGGAGALHRILNPRGDDDPDAERTLRRSATMAMAARMSWMLARGGELDPRLLRDWPKIVGCLANGKAQNEELSPYVKNMDAILRAIPMEILTEAKVKSDPEFQRGIEMRADEQLRAAFGLPNPEWDEIKDEADGVMASRVPNSQRGPGIYKQFEES
jgi:hypothetical protein